MPPGGQGSVGRGGSRTGWAAIAGIAIGALLLAGVEEPERAASVLRPAPVTAPLCAPAKPSARALAVRGASASTAAPTGRVSRADTAARRCAPRRLYP
jgi:hypothetical protein